MKKIIRLILLMAALETSLVAQPSMPFVTNLSPALKTISLPALVKLHYAEQGNPNGSPVIFLHGFTDSWHSYEKVMQELPENIHAYAITLRGHGNSEKPLDGYQISDFAGDVASFIRSQRLGKVVLVGHSLGGIIAQEFASRYPELLKGVVIIASSHKFSNNEGLNDFVSAVNALQDPIDPVFIDEFQKGTIFKPLDSNYYRILVNESAKVPAFVWKAVLAEVMRTDLTQSIARIQTPTAIFWGDKDYICSYADQLVMQNLISHSRLKIYEGVGHAIHWEEPQRFTRDLLEFIHHLK